VESENILAVNIPNGISILIMAIVGGLLLSMLRKAVKGNASNGNALASQQMAPGSSATQFGAY
jgi:chromate transport protein ChrA